MKGQTIRMGRVCWAVAVLLLLGGVQMQAAIANNIEVSLNKDDVFSIPFSALFPSLASSGTFKFQTNVTKIPMIEGPEKGANYLKVVPTEFIEQGVWRTDVTVSATEGEATTRCNVSITVVPDTIGRPEVDRAIRRIDAPFLRDSFVKFPIESELFNGNGLEIKGDILGAKGKPIGLMGYQAYPTDLALIGFHSVVERDIKLFHIGKDYLLAFDSKYHLHVFNCYDPSPISINCRRIATLDTNIDEASTLEITAAGKITSSSYFIVVKNVMKNSTHVFLSKGSAIYNPTLGEVIVSADGLMALGNTQSDPAVQPTIAIVTEGGNVGLLQYSAENGVSWKDNLVPKTICPTSLFSAGNNIIYVEGRCAESQGVYAYDINLTSAEKKIWQRVFPASDKKVEKVCFYDESLVVVRQNENGKELHLTNAKPNEDRTETFLLSEYGFTADWTLECVNDNRLFAVKSYDAAAKKYRYGIFDALSSGKALKRLISVMKDQELDLKPFGRDGNLVLAGFQSPGAIFAYTTFADGAQLFIDANGTPADDQTTNFAESHSLQAGNSTTQVEVPFSLMLTLTDYKKHQIQLPFVSSVVYQSKDIAVTARKVLDSTVGTFKLSSGASISGAVLSASLKNKDNPQTELVDVELQEGLTLNSKSPIGVSQATEQFKYGLPEFLTAADDLVITGTQSKDLVDNKLKLEVFKDQKPLYQLVLSPTRVQGFAAFKTAAADTVWVLFGDYSSNWSKQGKLNIVKLQNGKQAFSTSQPSPLLRNIKVVKFDTMVLVLGFSKPEGVTIWKASTSDPDNLTLSGKIPKAIDCTGYKDAKGVALMCITRRALEYLKYPVTESGSVSSSPSGKVAPEYPDPRYMFLDVVSKDTTDYLYLISNTASAYVTETRVNKTDLTFEQRTHFKMSYHEVGALAYAGSHIVASTYTSRFGLKIHELHTWKSAFLLAGGGQLSYAASLSNRSFVGEQNYEFSLPLAAQDGVAGQPTAGLVFVPYLDNDATQLHTYKVDEISVVFKSEKVDTESLVLQFQGMTANKVQLSTLFKPGAALKASKWSWLWWTLVFVTVILMILACFMAVVYYKRDDKSVYDNADNNDYSLSKMGETIGPHSAHNKHSVKGSVHDQDENVPA